MVDLSWGGKIISCTSETLAGGRLLVAIVSRPKLIAQDFRHSRATSDTFALSLASNIGTLFSLSFSLCLSLFMYIVSFICPLYLYVFTLTKCSKYRLRAELLSFTPSLARVCNVHCRGRWESTFTNGITNLFISSFFLTLFFFSFSLPTDVES